MRIGASGSGEGAVVDLDGAANSAGGHEFTFFASGSGNGAIGGGNWAVKDSTTADAGVLAYRLLVHPDGTIRFGGPAYASAGFSLFDSSGNISSSYAVATANVSSSASTAISFATGNGITAATDTGSIGFTTGSNSANGGNTGSFQSVTGAYTGTTAAQSGDVTFASGNSTPDIAGSHSGGLNMETGTSGYQSGDILIATGAGTVLNDAFSGGATVATGSVTGTASSGDIQLFTGTVGTGGTRGKILITGPIVTSGDNPNVSSCGTGSPSVIGNDVAGHITAGGGVLTSCTLTFTQSWSVAPVCMVDDESHVLLLSGNPSNGTLVITSIGSFSGDTIGYHCIGYQ